MNKNDLQISDGCLNALNETKHLIIQSQEKFLLSSNRISMDVRRCLGEIIDENSVKYALGKATVENFAEDLSNSLPDNFIDQFIREVKISSQQAIE